MEDWDWLRKLQRLTSLHLDGMPCICCGISHVWIACECCAVVSTSRNSEHSQKTADRCACMEESFCAGTGYGWFDFHMLEHSTMLEEMSIRCIACMRKHTPQRQRSTIPTTCGQHR